MLFHVKLEFDLDTETRQTTNVTPVVQTHEGAHVCRYPKCAKPIPLDQLYCDQACFRAHGKRPRLPKMQVVLPPMEKMVEHQTGTPTPQPIIQSPAPLPVLDYRSFTFPQGGLS